MTAVCKFGLVLLLVGLSMFILPGGAPADEVTRAEIIRYETFGGIYNAKGFLQMREQKTPYKWFHKVNTRLLAGQTVYINGDGVRIWKTLNCGVLDVIFMEYSIRHKNGKRIPFAWQDCNLPCRQDGACSADNQIFIDLDGNGRAEMMIPSVRSISVTSEGRVSRVNFKQDIIPAWVKAKVGSDYTNLYPATPEDDIPNWEDHPVGILYLTDDNPG